MADATVSWPQALAWRLARQGLDPIGDASVEEVVRGLGAIQAQHDAGSELSIRARQTRSEPGEVARALADGRLIKTFAFRGATHLMTPEDAGIYLALRASSRMWELPSWRSYYGLEPSDWPAFRGVVRDALGDGPMTVKELGAVVTSHAAFAHLGFAFGEGKGSLVKPLAWLGEMSFGPPRDGQATFQRLVGNPRWAGIPELEDAGPRAVARYLGTYGPTTPGHLRYWLGEGLGAGGKRIQAWIDVLGDRLAPVDVEGRPASSSRPTSERCSPPRRAPRCGSYLRMTSGFSARGLPIPMSFHRRIGRRSAAAPPWCSSAASCPGPGRPAATGSRSTGYPPQKTTLAKRSRPKWAGSGLFSPGDITLCELGEFTSAGT